MGAIPELRSEPVNKHGREEYEILMPIDVYWQLVEHIRILSFSYQNDMSTARAWSSIVELIKIYIVTEENRFKFIRSANGKR